MVSGFYFSFVTHPLGWAEVQGGQGIWAFPRQERAWMRFSQCEVKVIHSYWRHLLPCCPPESDPAWGLGCCTEAGRDLSCHWASFRKKLLAVSHQTSPGGEKRKNKRVREVEGEKQRARAQVIWYTANITAVSVPASGLTCKADIG